MYWVRPAVNRWADQSANGFPSGSSVAKAPALTLAFSFWERRNIIGSPPAYRRPQHTLNFFPLPHGHGSFLPTLRLPSGWRGEARRGIGGRGGLALGTSAAFLPVSFSRANSNIPLGSPSSSLTLLRCSSFSAF